MTAPPAMAGAGENAAELLFGESARLCQQGKATTLLGNETEKLSLGLPAIRRIAEN